jgi:2-aminoethylphosphonate-pyruvate transaminase
MIPIKRNILLTPGPATTSDTVKISQVVPDICPREIEFSKIMKFISDELTNFVADNDDYTTILLGGSGTAAVESILSSVVAENDTILVVNNGAYGERMCQIAEIYHLDYVEYKSPNISPLDVQALEKIISDKQISKLAVVHNETTTGLLNDINSIGKLCEKYKAEFIVDGVSSFAGIPINMKEMNISYLASCSNKNIQGIAGVGFVIANRSSLIKSKTVKKRNLYLNLFDQYDYFAKTGQTRFTPPVQAMYALKKAIEETKTEGILQRHERYSKSWDTLVASIQKMGLKLAVPMEHQSKLITAIYEPEHENFSFNEMHDYLYERGFTIYPGKVSGMNTFRIANVGDIDYTDIQNFLAELEKYLTSIGFISSSG